jgi:lipopolysaccharide transport system permease protein
MPEFRPTPIRRDPGVASLFEPQDLRILTSRSPTVDDLAPPPSLLTPRRKTSLAKIIAELWESRELVEQFMLRDITIRYHQAIMGFAWALMMPLLIVGAGLVFRVVLSTLADTPIQGTSIAGLAVKAVPWAFFAGGLSTATQSLLAQANLIGKVYFTRESIPIASVLAQAPDLVVSLVVVLIALPIVGVPMHLTTLWGLALLTLFILFTMGWALLLSCANLFFRDVKYILQIALNFGVFATPVFFEPQMLGQKGAAIMLALPLSPFIQGMDVAVVQGRNLLETVVLNTPNGAVVVWAPWMLAYAVAVSLALLATGLIVFRRTSGKFAEMA